MVEPIMYLAIGFLVAMLCSLMVMPLVHNRAVRLTTKRLEAATPLSMAEIQADKDQLRAEFAMSARKLELNVEQLKSRVSSQLAELGKKTDAINRLKLELSDKSATVFALEAREKALKDRVQTLEEELALKESSLKTVEKQLAEKQVELGKLTNTLSDRSAQADSRKVELVAQRTQIDALQTRMKDFEKQETAAQKRLVDLEYQLAQQGKTLADREAENETLRQQVEAAKQQSASQGVVSDTRSPAGPEQAENDLLRSRINDIAAEVAQLAATIEGPDSPIASILASDAKQGAGSSSKTQATLADRIRALQAQASGARRAG